MFGFSMLLFLISLICVFIFLIKKKNKKVKYSIVVVILSIIVIVATVPPSEKKVDSKKETAVTAVAKTEQETTSTSKKKTEKKIKAAAGEIVDGDTTWFTFNKSSKEVSYLLIDTPTTSSAQPYAEEAKSRTAELLSHAKTIELEYGNGDQKNQDGQTSMYVWADGSLVQEILVKEGLARVASASRSGTKYLTRLKKSESQAKSQKIGIWSVDGYASDQGFDVVVYNTYQTNLALKKTAEEAVAKAESEPNRENYNLAVTAVGAVPKGDSALSARIATVNTALTAQEQAAAKAAQEQAAAKAAQEQAAAKAAQEQAAAKAAQEQAAAKAAQEQAAAQQTEQVVYVAPQSGKKYHFDSGCRGLNNANSIVSMPLSQAQTQGYTLCGWED